MVTLALIRDTFREALARKIFWGLFGLSTLMILFFLFLLRIDIVEGGSRDGVAVSAATIRTMPDVDRVVRGVYGGIATFLYTWGMFLAVFASAGLIPSVLEPGRIELLLSKPLSRTHILLGRYRRQCSGGLAQHHLPGAGRVDHPGREDRHLVAGLSDLDRHHHLHLRGAALGGGADRRAVRKRRGLATMITVALMIISPILAQTSLMMRLLSSEWSRNLWRALYYSLPKVYELGKMTLDAIQSRTFAGFMPIWSFGSVRRGDAGRGPGDLRAERFLVRSASPARPVASCASRYPCSRAASPSNRPPCTSAPRSKRWFPPTRSSCWASISRRFATPPFIKSSSPAFRCRSSTGSPNRPASIRARIFRRSCSAPTAKPLCSWCAGSFALPI